jgi:hypothetical protein
MNKIDHPDFYIFHEYGAGGYPVAEFKRDFYDESIPVFTKADCAEMLRAVEAALPEYAVGKTWNGAGCCSFSVSIKLKTKEQEND